MVGGLLQLTAKGAQDIYLTGNPQITFFKVVYRRYTNFAIESILQTWDNSIANGVTLVARIDRKGDLIHKMYIQQRLNTNTVLTGNLINYGYDFIKEVDIKIGTQIIDKHTNNFLETYAELTEKNEYGNLTSAHNALFMNSAPNIGMGHETGNNVHHTATKFQTMTMAGGVGSYEFIPWHDGTSYNASSTNNNPSNIDGLNNNAILIPNFTNNASITTSASATTVNDYGDYLFKNTHHYIYTPLQFWFCRNIGLALPLIALQYDEVSIELKIKELMDTTATMELYVDFIFLDTDERRRFSQISHEYLIEQLQIRKGLTDETNNLTLKNQVKELIWVSGDGNSASYSGPLKGNWNIQINSNDRFTPRDTSYFTKQQINDYHTGYGGVTERNSIAVYSFCLHPEDHQPSGTINLSAINNLYLVCTPRDSEDISQTITVYAINYNVLRVLSGQGKLAYVN